ncbi:unnamed protein product [Rhizoctonia solani]|uniref:Ribosomal protein s17 n=1 Tax=Rhizoctonia solani TaxID=456999 RepID=A0A8H3AXX6_9AGAM
MLFNPSAILAVLAVLSVLPAYATHESSLPSVRRSLASKLERRAEKIKRQQDAQKSLTLEASQIAKGLANDGQQGGGDPGQVPSLTSTNNFINFCLTQNVPLTNGQQVRGGSCNGVPMGRIIGSNKMPSAKFVSPKNGDTIQANTAFTIRMAISNMVTGNFVNPTSNYYSAPQQVDGSGTVIGHSHVTVELLSSLDQTTVTDPQKFAFFKGLNNAAQGGVLTADVTAGLPAGPYRMCSINSAANHQPVLVAVAQRGSVDDCVYIQVGNANGGNGGNGNAGGGQGGGNSNNGGNNQNNGGNNQNNGGNNQNNGGNNQNNGGNNQNNGGNNQNNGGNNQNNGGNNSNNGGNKGGNFQTFAGALGGAAPSVTAGGKGFLINGDSFINKNGALQRSCDIQKNACADAANSSGNKAPLTVAACETQAQQCSAAIS